MANTDVTRWFVLLHLWAKSLFTEAPDLHLSKSTCTHASVQLHAYTVTSVSSDTDINIDFVNCHHTGEKMFMA